MQQQNRNLILFIILSSLIIFGWSFVRPLIWPPPPKPVPPPIAKPTPKPDPRQTAIPNLFGRPAGATNAGLADAALIAQEVFHLADTFRPPADPRKLANWPKRDYFVANLIAGLGGMGTVEAPLGTLARLSSEWLVASWGDTSRPNLLVLNPGEGRELPPVVLGSAKNDSPFFVRVRLAAKGAGVRQLILNRFEKADSQGRPVRGEPLELITEDLNRTVGSNLLYHSEKPADTHQRPLDTLGQTRVWDVIRAPTAGKVVEWNPDSGILKLRVQERDFTFVLPVGEGAPTLTESPVMDRDVIVVWGNVGDRAVIHDVLSANAEQAQTVAFSTAVQDVIVTKSFTLNPRAYHLDLEIKIEPRPGVTAPIDFRYHLTSGHGLPIEGDWYTNTFRNSLIGVTNQNGYCSRSFQDLASIVRLGGGDEVTVTNPIDAENALQYGGIGVQFFASIAAVRDHEEGKDVPLRHLERARSTIVSSAIHGKVKAVKGNSLVIESAADRRNWTVLVPENEPDLQAKLNLLELAGVDAPVAVRALWTSRDQFVAQELFVGPEASRLMFADINVHMISNRIELKPGQSQTHRFVLYNGPLKVRLLGQMSGDQAVPEEYLTLYRDQLHLDTLTDAPWQWFGQGFFQWTGLTTLLLATTNLMHFVLWALHSYVFPWSWGVCIILLTVLVRGLMHPLSRKATLNSLKMQALQPELKKLREKHKDDQQGLGLAQMELYRKHKVSLFGSCWTMFLQMPIFMGLYWCLQESIHFRLAPFWASLPWIENLAAPDMLFPWPWMPFVSDPASFGQFYYLGPFFNLLPVVAACLMLVVQKMMMPPATTEQEEMQQKMMKWMPIMMAVLFFKVASGLCIYFIVSSLWGLVERKLLLPKKHPDHIPTEGEAEKKGEEKPSLLSRALEKFQSTNSKPAMESPSALEAPGSGKGSRKNRRQRKRDRQKTRKPSESSSTTGTPPTNGAANGGFLDRIKAWCLDILKKAEKK